MAGKTRTFVYQEKLEDPNKRGALAFYSPKTNSFTVLKRPDSYRGPQDAERFNRLSHSEMVACHEQKHQDNALAGMYAYAMSPEQAYKVNMHDEISANIAQLIDLRKQYLETGDVNVFKAAWPCFEFYYNAIMSKEINPRSQYKEDFDKEMRLIANGTKNMWLKKFSEGKGYTEQNSSVGASKGEISGKHARYYNQNYERAKKIAYGNIGGVDFTKYMDGDVEIPPKGKELLDKKVTNIKKNGRPGKPINFGNRYESNPPINYVNRNTPTYNTESQLFSRQIPDMRTNIIEQPTMSHETPAPARQGAAETKPQDASARQQRQDRPASSETATNPEKPETGAKKEKIDMTDKDIDYALRAVPTYVQDFMKVNGMLDDGHKWMNTRQLKEYLSSVEFTPENKKLLEDYLKDKNARKAEFNAYMKDKTKNSMRESYAKKAQVAPQQVVDDKLAESQKKIEEKDRENTELKKKLAEQKRAIAEYKANAPLAASRGKAEVQKDNGKKKEKNAVIVKDMDGNTFVITKDMVKDARDQLGKDALPSWGKIKDAAETGYVNPNIVRTLFDKGEPKYGKYQKVQEKPAEVKTAKVKLTSTVEGIPSSQTAPSQNIDTPIYEAATRSIWNQTKGRGME